MAPVAALLVVQLIFGLNYVASKVILAIYPPLLWGGIRMLISAMLMFLLCMFFVPNEKRTVSTSFLVRCLVFSFFGIALNQGFFLLGLSLTTPANSAIINTLTPVLTLMMAVVLGREKLTAQKVVGFLFAFCGVLVLRRIEDFSFSSTTFQGDFYTFLNCLSLAMFFTMAADFLKRHSVLWVTAWLFLFGAILLGCASVTEIQEFVLHPVDTNVWIAMIYNIVGATVITYYLNSWALARVNSSLVALFIYLQPVIAVFFAWYTFDEVPELRMFLAIGMIFSGVVLATWKKKLSKSQHPSVPTPAQK
jgi:drug/metabolite transporter (DMT)-like permease